MKDALSPVRLLQTSCLLPLLEPLPVNLFSVKDIPGDISIIFKAIAEVTMLNTFLFAYHRPYQIILEYNYMPLVLFKQGTFIEQKDNPNTYINDKRTLIIFCIYVNII